MNHIPSDASGSDPVFFEFQCAFEEAGDRSAYLEQMCARHAERAREFRDYADVAGLLREAGDPTEEPIPDRLGEFVLKRRVGRSMGEVFEAWQPSLQRRVAVKMIRQGRTSPEARQRFEREQKWLAKLHQTHIVPIHTVGEVGPLHYFVMPFIDGASLHHVVHTARSCRGSTPPLSKLAELTAFTRAQPTLSPSAAARQETPPAVERIEPAVGGAADRLVLSAEFFRSVAMVMADAAEALEHAHNEGVIHRDLKPANLMVDRQGHCWLIDFGLASGEGKGEVAGTPPYMPREAWEGVANRLRDVYGLGVTLYELLTLRPAFADGPNEEVRRRILSETPPAPRVVAPETPRDLDAICRKAMHAEGARRYETAGEFAADLRRWLGGEPTRARPAWLGRRVWMWARREPWRAAAAVLSMLVLLGCGGWFVEKELAAAARKIGEARKETQKSEEQLNLFQLQQTRLGDRIAGWSKVAIKAGERAAQQGATPELRSQVAAALVGLDAEEIKRTEGAASSSAFDRTGKLLLRGGVEGKPAELLDVPADRLKAFKQTGPGPVAFLANGTPVQLVTTGGGWPLRLVDLPNDRAIQELSLPERERLPILRFALSGDCSTAASVQGKQEKGTYVVHVWDVKAGKAIHSLEQPAVTSLALSPDGRELAIGREDGRITFWEAKIAAPSTLEVGRLAITALSFGRDPQRTRTGRPWLLASGDAGGSIQIWEPIKALVRARCHGAHFHIYSLAFSPDGMTLASGGRGVVLLWDIATGRLVFRFGQVDHVAALAISPDGKTIAASSSFGKAPGLWHKVWSLDDKRGMQHLRGLTGQIASVRLSRDGKRMAALAQNWDVGVWDLDTGHLLHVLPAPPGLSADNAGLQFSPDGEELAFCAGQEARRWEVKSGRETGRWKMPPGLVDRLLFEAKTGELIVCRVETRDGKRFPLADAPVAEHPRVVRFYELQPKGERKLIVGKDDFPARVFQNEASPDGKCFVIQGISTPRASTKTLKAFSPRGKELWKTAVDVKYPGFTFDATGRQVCFNAGDRIMTLVESATGRVVRSIPRFLSALTPGGEPWVWYANGPKGKWLGIEYSLRVTDHPILNLGIDQSASGPLRFNHTHTHLAWGNEDGTVIVCDLPAVQRRLAGIGLGW